MSSVVWMALLVILVAVQGQRDETRQAGAAIVLGAEQWDGTRGPEWQAPLDQALDLYRRGVVSRIILTGGKSSSSPSSPAAAGRTYLLEQRLPAEALLVDEDGSSIWQQMQRAAQLVHTQGISSVLLVCEPFQMLRSLKMAHDLRLVAYGSTMRTSQSSASGATEMLTIMRESWAYLVYVFARR